MVQSGLFIILNEEATYAMRRAEEQAVPKFWLIAQETTGIGPPLIQQGKSNTPLHSPSANNSLLLNKVIRVVLQEAA